MALTLCLLAAALTAGAQPDDKGDEAQPWPTYVSKEGKFVVDFPAAPTSTSSKTSSGPSGKVKILLAICDTPAVAYIVQKVVLPTAVIRGAEETALNNYRDTLVKEYNAKLTSEKKVRGEGGKPGRDFTLVGQGAPGGPVSVLRIRLFLTGPAIFALIAVSADNHELPAEAGRFFGSFAEGTSRPKRTGPKAEAVGKELAGWGSAVDPDGDCELGPDGAALVVKVPGTLHDLNADIDKFNAPRVLRDVEGDFSMTVKVAGDFKPGPKSNNPKSVPYNGGGLVVWRDSDNYIRLERGAIVRKEKLGTFATFEEREGGSRGAQHNGTLAPGPVWLRLERRGSRVAGFTSKDGRQWTALRPIDTVWPDEIKVGLVAVNSSNEPLAVRFEDLQFKAGRSASPAAKRGAAAAASGR